MSSLDVGAVDLTDATLYREGFPHELFAELRRAGAVHRHPAVAAPPLGVELEFWSVVRHDEIERANRDWQTFSAREGIGLGPTQPERRGHTIVSMDPSDHTRMRRLISAGFTPRMIGKLEERIATRTERILDDVEARGECDFVKDVAYQLPMHVIADIVGIPEDERPWVFERTEVFLKALDPTSPLTEADQRSAEADLFDYAQRLSRRKRAEPADDVWTTLTVAEIDVDGGRTTALTELELDMFFVILTLAGSETTRNAISQGLMALLDHPDQLSDLRADPGLAVSAADEMIRWASPVLYFGRTATTDVELGGAPIRAGDRIVLWYPSGNRDGAAFADPFRFDIRRSPNPHVSFGGGGPHYCLGANLAKKEVQVMMRAVVDRFDVELSGAPVWSGGGPVHNV
ncbi:MAG TPA: cytochrome P450, partial [Acidimicrobiia bacterium]|nr:cytochrome P450 [Acidimicrobiia bacterium]